MIVVFCGGLAAGWTGGAGAGFLMTSVSLALGMAASWTASAMARVSSSVWRSVSWIGLSDGNPMLNISARIH